MGVHKLWEILSPAGKNVKLEALSGKRLAIDVSIWLMSFENMRDEGGRISPNAYLLGLYHRLCKLLYYKIKPIFVFDGATPEIKKQTLENRRQARQQRQSLSYKKLAERILKERLAASQQRILNKSSKNNSGTPSTQSSQLDTTNSPISTPSPSPTQPKNSSTPKSSNSNITNKNNLNKSFGNSPQIKTFADIDLTVFQELPVALQDEILRDLNSQPKKHFNKRSNTFPSSFESPNPSSFSSMQIARLLKSSENSKKKQHSSSQIISQRVASEEGTTFSLIKLNNNQDNNSLTPSLQKGLKEEEQEDYVISDEEIALINNRNSAKRKLDLSDSPSSLSNHNNDHHFQISIDPFKRKNESDLFDLSLIGDSSFMDEIHSLATPSTKNSYSKSNNSSFSDNSFINLTETNISSDEEKEEEFILSTSLSTSQLSKLEESESEEEQEEEEEEQEEVGQVIEIIDLEDEENIDKEGEKNVLQINDIDPHKQLELEAIKLLKQSECEVQSVLGEMFVDMQRLLMLFGVPYILSPTEAEAQCAELFRLKLIDGIITDDSDIFLFGGDCVYKNVFNKDRDVEFYSLNNIKTEVGLTRDDFIKLALLLGSDYTEGVYGIGMVTAMEIIEQFKGENGLQDFMKWINGDENFKKHKANKKLKYLKKKKEKLLFPQSFPNPQVINAYLHPQVQKSEETFEWSLPQIDELKKFMTKTFGWNEEKMNQTLNPLVNRLKDLSNDQSTLDEFGIFVGHLTPVIPNISSLRLLKVISHLSGKKHKPKPKIIKPNKLKIVAPKKNSKQEEEMETQLSPIFAPPNSQKEEEEFARMFEIEQEIEEEEEEELKLNNSRFQYSSVETLNNDNSTSSIRNSNDISDSFISRSGISGGSLNSENLDPSLVNPSPSKKQKKN